MGVEVWMLKSWPLVFFAPPLDGGEWPRMSHAHTRARRDESRGMLWCGDTVWVGVVANDRIGVGWEWAEVRPGVVLLADPNQIVTNLRFLTPGVDHAERSQTVVTLNALLHSVDWQRAVLHASNDDALTSPMPASRRLTG